MAAPSVMYFQHSQLVPCEAETLLPLDIVATWSTTGRDEARVVEMM